MTTTRYCVVAMAALVAGGHLRAQEPAVRFSVERDLAVGDTQVSRFGAVHTLVATGDGGFVVYDAMVGALRRYDPNGGVVWSRPIGHGGSYSSAAVDDSLVGVIDTDGSQRVLFFRLNSGVPVGAVELKGKAGEAFRILGRGEDAWLIVHERTQELVGRRMVPLGHSTYSLLRVRPSSSDVKISTTWVDSTPRRVLENGVRYTVIRPPLLRPPAFGETGRGLVLHAAPGSADLEVLDALGNLLRTLTIPDRVPVPATDRVLIVESAIERYSQLPATRVAAAIRELPLPEAYPPVGALYGAADGSVAVIRADRFSTVSQRRDSTQVDIYAPSGRRIGYVVLPVAESVRAFDGRNLFVVRTDSARSAGVVEGRSRQLMVVERLRIVEAVRREDGRDAGPRRLPDGFNRR